MSRNFTYSALTLRVRSASGGLFGPGGSNREAWFLTAEEGLVRATVFGGPKSRLRALVAPFHEGKLWVYHDPVRDSRKVSDFDVRAYRPGLRELYERAMAADAVAETILSSHGGGNDGSGGGWKTAVLLAAGVLDALNEADAPLCSRLGVYFLWHWAQILGVQPDLSASFDSEEPGSAVPKPGPGARLWLNQIESLPPQALASLPQDQWSCASPSLEQAGTFSKAVLAEALGRRLPTWDGI